MNIGLLKCIKGFLEYFAVNNTGTANYSTSFYYKKTGSGDTFKEGENTLEIKVVNLWRNRITGD